MFNVKVDLVRDFGASRGVCRLRAEEGSDRYYNERERDAAKHDSQASVSRCSMREKCGRGWNLYNCARGNKLPFQSGLLSRLRESTTLY